MTRRSLGACTLCGALLFATGESVHAEPARSGDTVRADHEHVPERERRSEFDVATRPIITATGTTPTVADTMFPRYWLR
ncbi:MAG: hypothetical protein L0216_01505 [Planctomycetales bacterium]|nr:hypothetical protein [Planctomycetales bacterium]